MQKGPKLLLLFFCTTCLFLTGFSQKKNEGFQLLLTTGPAVLRVPKIQWGIQPGIQLQNKSWAFGAEVAFPFYKKDRLFASVKYVRWGAEIKKFLSNEEGSSSYISVQAQYSLRHFTDTNGGHFFFKGPTDRYNYTSARINSPLLAVALKGGYQLAIGKKWMLDFSTGLGIRTIYTRYHAQNVTPARDNLFDSFQEVPAYRYNKTVSRLHLTTGFRLAYRIS